MLQLVAEHSAHRNKRTLGPAVAFRIGDGQVVSHPDNTVLATYEGSTWTIEGEHFLELVPQGTVRVRLEDGAGKVTGTYGPFDALRIVDGAIRHGPSGRDLLARWDADANAWYVYADASYWLAAVLLPA